MVFNTGLVQNLGHIIVFLEFWVQLFKENLGTRRLAIKLQGTQVGARWIKFSEWVYFKNNLNITKIGGFKMGVAPKRGPRKFKPFKLDS